MKHKLYKSFWFVCLTGLIFGGLTNSKAQTTIATNFTNNNGSAAVVFNFTNNNPFAVIITDIASIPGSSGIQTASAWFTTSPTTGPPISITAANGFTQFGINTAFNGIANTTTNTPLQPMISGMSLLVPPATTYRIGLVLSVSLRYSTLAAGVFTFSGGGCDIVTGTDIGFGGTQTAITFTPRGFIGSVTFMAAVPCTGTPTPGNTLSSSAGVCTPSSPVTLSLENSTVGTGVTYQWQNSTNGGVSWNNIASANNPTLTTTQSVVTDYRCEVTCAGNPPALSNPVQVILNTFINCYCSPVYTSFDGTDAITNVTLNTLNNPSGATPLPCYIDYVPLGTTLNTGSTYNISMTASGTTSENMSAWIDYDHSGTFDASELILPNIITSVSFETVSANFTVPVGALAGITRMRAVSHFAAPAIPCNTTGFGETEDYQINIVIPPPCSGTPTPGNTLTTETDVCASTPFTLSLQNNTIGAGITYQWQNSVDGGVTWNNIVSATNPTLTTTQTETSQYRCEVKCLATPGISIPVQVNQNTFIDCYCTPFFDSFDGTDFISNVTLNTLNNSSFETPLPGYISYIPLGTTLFASTPYTIFMTTGAYPDTENCGAWIDFNHDGIFDASEQILPNSISSTAFQTFSSTFLVPPGALTGNTRLRVVLNYGTIASPCPEFGFGEAEDYEINILPAPPCAGTPNPGITNSTTCNSCAGQNFTLSLENFTIGGGVSYQWQSAPTSSGPWADVGPNFYTWTTTQSSANWYRSIVTCASSTSTPSTPIFVDFGPCYCEDPLYSGFGTNGFNYIGNFTFAGINNTTGNNNASVPPYQSFTCLSATVNQGASYSVGISTPPGDAFFQLFKVYIDYNKNGSFEDAGEMVYTSGFISTSGNSSFGSISIPLTAPLGTTRIRVRSTNPLNVFNNDNSCTDNGAIGEVEDYTIVINAALPCAGTPAPGQTKTDAALVCASSTINLSLQNPTSGLGVTYQWQSSPDNITYTNMPGGTSNTHVTSQTATTWYRCEVSCSGSPGLSIPVLVTSSLACYCTTPVTGSDGCDLGLYIYNISFGTLNNTSGCFNAIPYTNPFYSYFPGVTATFSPGYSYPISITTPPNPSIDYFQFYSVWIDYNDNGSFDDAGELIFSANPNTLLNTASGMVTIPSGAPLGLHQIRFRSGNAELTSSCSSNSFSGEVEDYTILFEPCINTFVNVTSTNPSLCRGASSTLTAQGTGPYAWSNGETTQSITVTPLFTETFTVQTGIGCGGLGSSTVTVIGGPLAAASVSPAGFNCPGLPVNLFANLATGTSTTPSFNGPGVSISPSAAALGTPAPSPISASGLAGPTTVTSVTINNLNHTFAADLEVALRAPNGETLLLFGGVGGGNDYTGQTYTFQDGGAFFGGAPAPSGTYAPGNGTWSGPIVTPNIADLAGFTGNMNGAWGLFVYDNFAADGGAIESWSITFNTTSTPFNINGTVTYSWTGTNGFTSNLPDPTDNPLATTTYTLVVADNTCTSSSQTTKSVYPQPLATFTTDQSNFYCENQDINFNATIVGLQVVGSPPGPGSITIFIDGSGSFLDETQWEIRNQFGAVIYTGGPYPFFSSTDVQTFTPALNDYPLTFFWEAQGFFSDNFGTYSITCDVGSTLMLSGNFEGTAIGGPGTATIPIPGSCIDPGAPGSTITWSGPGGFNSGIEDPELLNAQIGNTGFYTLTFNDGNGCIASQTQYIEVNPNPAVIVTTTPVECFGGNNGTVTFDIMVQPIYNDYLTQEGSNNGSSNPQTFTGYVDGTYNYQVTEINSSCVTSGSFVIETAPNIAPVIICPADIVIGNTPGMCGAIVNYTPPVGTDNCPGGLLTTLQAGPVPGGFFPIGTTVVRYRVTDDQNLFAECTFSVTIEDTEFPSLVSGSSCPGDITSCNPVSWIAPSFQDNCPGLQVNTNQSPGVDFPIGVTPVTYTATDLKGNSTTCTFNVTVLDTSMNATDITSNRDFNNICAGGDITLAVNGGHLGEITAGVSAQWTWYAGGCGAGAVVGTGTSLTVSPAVTTTYFARAEGGCHTTECVQVTVIVSNTPPSGGAVFTTIPVQGGPGITDVVAVNPVPGATFYSWFTINGHNSSILFNGNLGPVQTSLPTVNVTFVLPQQNYHVRVIAGNGCGRTNTSNIVIRGTVPAPTSMNGPIQACPGSPVTYSIQPIPNGSPITYNWELVPASAGTITMAPNGLSATVVFNGSVSSAQVCANGISTFGLPGPPYCTTVTSSAPVPGAITGNTTPCSGNPVPEVYSITSVPSAVSYSWTSSVSGAIVVPDPSGLSASISFPAGSFIGTVEVTASSACGTSAPSILNITNGVPGDPGPISGASGGLCGAQDAAFNVTTSNALSYLWTVTTGMSIDGPDNLNAVTIDFLPGFTSGTVSVEAFYACGSVIKNHPVSGTPSAPVIAPSALCANSFQTYFVTNIEASTDYTWTTTGDILNAYCAIGSASNCTGYFIETGPGGGSFTVTATNSCGSAFTISDPCRITAEPIEIEIYPNPTFGKVTVELYSKMGGNYKVSISDLSGRQVFSRDFKAISGLNQQEIDLGFVNAGLYMVYVKDSNGNIGVTKLAVE